MLPGFSKEITDRAHQRRPRHMTTLIFRSYFAGISEELARPPEVRSLQEYHDDGQLRLEV